MSTALKLGSSAQLPRALVEQACVKYLQDMLAEQGVRVPARGSGASGLSLVGFLNRARLHFLDEHGEEVSIHSVVINWEE